MTAGGTPLEPLPRADGPLFREAWEAQVFALAVGLCEAGRVATSDWSAALGAEIEAAQAAGDPDLGDTYYAHWLHALQRVLAERGLVSEADLERRTQEWRAAYERTPHGQPVVLRRPSGPGPGG